MLKFHNCYVVHGQPGNKFKGVKVVLLECWANAQTQPRMGRETRPVLHPQKHQLVKGSVLCLKHRQPPPEPPPSGSLVGLTLTRLIQPTTALVVKMCVCRHVDWSVLGGRWLKGAGAAQVQLGSPPGIKGKLRVDLRQQQNNTDPVDVIAMVGRRCKGGATDGSVGYVRKHEKDSRGNNKAPQHTSLMTVCAAALQTKNWGVKGGGKKE